MAQKIDPSFIKTNPVDMIKYRKQIIAFRKDSFIISFGSAELLLGKNGLGIESYLQTLESRSQSLPGSCVHVFYRDRLVGQIELRFSRTCKDAGYVNLFYLISDYRMLGIGLWLDQYAMRFFHNHNKTSAYLNVSYTNHHAIKFYLKNGWMEREIFSANGNKIMRMRNDINPIELKD